MIVDTRRGGKCSNLGLWILTAISLMCHMNKKETGLVVKFNQLKAITIDISTPMVQMIDERGEPVMLADMDYPRQWQNSFPLQLQAIQNENGICIGGDVSCLVDAHMPALQTIRMRCKDQRGALGMAMGLHVLKNICIHRKLDELSSMKKKRKCNRLVVYSMYADQSLASPETETGRRLLEAFQHVEFRPSRDFPFF